jgi:hypothetical protein
MGSKASYFFCSKYIIRIHFEMACYLTVDDEEAMGKVNIDELYEKKQRRDQKQLAIFNKILNRIHKRIKFTSHNKTNDKHIWFAVPEYIFGEPVYDQGDCIGYLVNKLEENGFHIRYVHPNTLFISWSNWIPSYVRSEIKKKTGMVIDEKGNVVEKGEEESDPNGRVMNDNNVSQKSKKEYTPVNQYRPTGNLVYNPEMFENLEKKIKIG